MMCVQRCGSGGFSGRGGYDVEGPERGNLQS